MNEIRRIVPEAEEVATIRGIMARHALPDFVRGFDVRLGEFDEEPALWIILQVAGRQPEGTEERFARAKTLHKLTDELLGVLQSEFPQRYPYFRFVEA